MRFYPSQTPNQRIALVHILFIIIFFKESGIVEVLWNVLRTMNQFAGCLLAPLDLIEFQRLRTERSLGNTFEFFLQS